MNKLFFVTGLILVISDPVVSVKDFKPAFGNWTGTLTYLDYTSGKPYTMPANIRISVNPQNAQQIILAIEYPKEPQANGNDTLSISEEGKILNGAKVILKQKSKRVLKIITEKEGLDGNDNKKAVIRYIYTISNKNFSKRKEVRFENEEKWILRNEYKMNR